MQLTNLKLAASITFLHWGGLGSVGFGKVVMDKLGLACWAALWKGNIGCPLCGMCLHLGAAHAKRLVKLVIFTIFVLKSLFQPVFGVRSTQTLVEIYNRHYTIESLFLGFLKEDSVYFSLNNFSKIFIFSSLFLHVCFIIICGKVMCIGLFL